jgi:hypothetical protein
MAALQNRNGLSRVIFNFRNQQHAFTVDKVDEVETRQWKAKTEFVLISLKQHLLDIPAGADIVTFSLKRLQPLLLETEHLGASYGPRSISSPPSVLFGRRDANVAEPLPDCKRCFADQSCKLFDFKMVF